MAKDVNKTQKKETKEEIKQQPKKVVKKNDAQKQPKKAVKKTDVQKQPEKDVVKEKKVVVEEKVKTKEIVKEIQESKKNENKLATVVKKVDDNRKAILFGVVGFLLATLLFRCILWPDRIATLSDGTQPVVNIDGEPYTADQLYEDMKENYSISVLLNEIDNKILTELYPEDDDMIEEAENTLQSYYTYYQNYGYSEEDIIAGMGFNSEEQFLESLKLDYRRNLYYEDYAEGLISDEEIQKYYDDEVYGDVDSKHILVKVVKDGEEGLTDAEAKKLAQEIIKKLDGGTSWDDVITEYKDKIVTENLGYNAFNADFEAPYLEECKNLEVGKYSKTPVKTSYGYHVVYKIDQKETPKLEEVKDDIVDILASEEKENDENLYYKALISMREDAKLEFIDTVFGDAYTKYISQYK